MSVEITTATAASDAELAAPTTFLWGQTGVGPASERRIAIGNMVIKDAAGVVPGVSKYAQLTVNTATPLGFAETLSVKAAASGYAVAFQGTVSGAAVQSVWNSAATGNNVLVSFHTDAGGATRGSVTFNRAAGTMAYNTTSDYRSKVISGPVIDSSAVIDALRPVIGRMKGARQSRPMFVAHEVERAGAAYAVTGKFDDVDEDGKAIYQQLDVSLLIPVMVAELQALRARVAALEATSQLFHGR